MKFVTPEAERNWPAVMQNLRGNMNGNIGEFAVRWAESMEADFQARQKTMLDNIRYGHEGPPGIVISQILDGVALDLASKALGKGLDDDALGNMGMAVGLLENHWLYGKDLSAWYAGWWKKHIRKPKTASFALAYGMDRK